MASEGNGSVWQYPPVTRWTAVEVDRFPEFREPRMGFVINPQAQSADILTFNDRGGIEVWPAAIHVGDPRVTGPLSGERLLFSDNGIFRLAPIEEQRLALMARVGMQDRLLSELVQRMGSAERKLKTLKDPGGDDPAQPRGRKKTLSTSRSADAHLAVPEGAQ